MAIMEMPRPIVVFDEALFRGTHTVIEEKGDFAVVAKPWEMGKGVVVLVGVGACKGSWSRRSDLYELLFTPL